MLKVMDHGEYQRRLRSKSLSELLWIIKDAGAAAAAMPDNPNCGFYLDEVSYARMEIQRRQKL